MSKQAVKTCTPGPWLVIRRDAEHALISTTTGRDWCNPDHYIGRVRSTHARLIASAPLMLASLNEIRNLAAVAEGGSPLAEIVLNIATLAISAAGGDDERP